jgi:hypothetical protein
VTSPTYDELIQKLRPAHGVTVPDGQLEAIQLLGDLAHIEQRMRESFSKLLDQMSHDLLRAAQRHPALADLGKIVQSTGGIVGVPPAGLENNALLSLSRDVRIDTENWYYKAFRVLHLTGAACPGVRDVRNQLIEHPDKKKHSGVTHPTFGWTSKNGPRIKGVRVKGQTGFDDPGLFVNSEAFRSAVSKACAQRRFRL